jgi:putative peptidoglycan lipid II flippase
MLRRFYSRFSRASQDGQRILKGMVAVAGFLLLAKGIAAAKEVMLAHSYGTSAVLDGHFFAFNLASWPLAVLATAMWFGLTPAWVKLNGCDQAVRRQAAGDLLGLVLLVALSLAVVVGGILHWLLQGASSGLGPVARAAALASVWSVLIFLVLGCLAALFSIWLMSAQRHANTLLEAAPSAAIVLCVLVALRLGSPQLGVMPLNVGLALGSAVQLGLLVWLFKVDGPKAVSLPGRGSVVWGLLQGMGVALFAQVIMSSTMLVDTLVLARMGEGALTAYTYAHRLMALATGLTAMVISRSVLPVFSAQTDKSISLNLAKTWGFRMFGLGCVGSIIISLLARPAVALLFQHGAFTADDTSYVAKLLQLLSLQLPFYMVSTLWFSWLISAGSVKAYILMAGVGAITKLLAVWYFFDMAAEGLALSTVLVCLSHWAVVLIFARRFTR